MKKIIPFLILLFFSTTIFAADSVKRRYNVFTSRLDLITDLSGVSGDSINVRRDLDIEIGDSSEASSNSTKLNASMRDNPAKNYHFPGGVYFFGEDTTTSLRTSITFDGTTIAASNNIASSAADLTMTGVSSITPIDGEGGHVEGVLKITGGTGDWIPGYYQIIAIDEGNGEWVLDRAPSSGTASAMEGVATFPVAGSCVITPALSSFKFGGGGGIAHDANINNEDSVTKIVYNGPNVIFALIDAFAASNSNTFHITSGYTVIPQDMNATLQITDNSLDEIEGLYNINAADPDNNTWELDQSPVAEDINITNGVYDHTGNGEGERHLSSTGAFSGYTFTSGDKIYISSTASSNISVGLYEVASKVDSDAILLTSAAGLTADDTSVVAANAVDDFRGTMTYTLWKDESHGNDYDGMNMFANNDTNGVLGVDDDEKCHVCYHVATNRKGINTGKVNFSNALFRNCTVAIMAGRNMSSGLMGDHPKSGRDIGYGDNVDYDGASDNHADNIFLYNLRGFGSEVFFNQRTSQSVGHLIRGIRFINTNTGFYFERGTKAIVQDINMGGSRDRFVRFGAFTNNAGLLILKNLVADGQSNDVKIIQFDGTPSPGLASSNYPSVSNTQGRVSIDGVHYPGAIDDWTEPVVDAFGAVRMDIRNWDQRILPGSIQLESHTDNSDYRPFLSLKNAMFQRSVAGEDSQDILHANTDSGIEVNFDQISSSRNNIVYKRGVYLTGTGWLNELQGTDATFNNLRASDATFTSVGVSGLTVSECVEVGSNGVLTTSGSACGAGGAGDITAVGNTLSGEAGTAASNTSVTFTTLNTTGTVGVQTTNPLNALHVTGDDATDSTGFIALFQEPGVTTEGSGLLSGSNSDRAIAIQGNGAAYVIGRDVSNDIEFIMGTSNVGEAFVGSATNHDVTLRAGNQVIATLDQSTNRMIVDTSDKSAQALLDVGGGTATSIDSSDDLLVADDVEIDGDLYVEGNTTGTDATFTAVGISGLTVSECVQVGSNGVLTTSGDACGAGGSGDITQVGNILSGAAGTSSSNDVTFGNLQATNIGFVLPGDGTFTNINIDQDASSRSLYIDSEATEDISIVQVDSTFGQIFAIGGDGRSDYVSRNSGNDLTITSPSGYGSAGFLVEAIDSANAEFVLKNADTFYTSRVAGGGDYVFRQGINNVISIQSGSQSNQIRTTSDGRLGLKDLTPDGEFEVNGDSSAGVPTVLITSTDVDEDALEIVSSQTSGNSININADSLTTGTMLRVDSNSSDTSTRNLVEITNDNTLAAGASLLDLRQDAADKAIFIDMNGDGEALTFDVESTTKNVIDIDDPKTTTGVIINVNNADALTTGKLMLLRSNSAETNTRTLAKINNVNSAATGTTSLEVEQNAASLAMLVNQDADGVALQISADSTSEKVLQIENASTQSANIVDVSDADALTTGRIMFLESSSADTNSRELLQITNNNAAATGTVLLKLDQDSTGNIIELIDDSTTVVTFDDQGHLSGQDASFTEIDVNDGTDRIYTSLGTQHMASFESLNYPTPRVYSTGGGGGEIPGLSIAAAGGRDWRLEQNRAINSSYHFSITDCSAGCEERLVVDTSGDIGIGVDFPTHKLHVAGNMTATDATFTTLSSTDATFNTAQATRIGNVSPGVASFTNMHVDWGDNDGPGLMLFGGGSVFENTALTIVDEGSADGNTSILDFSHATTAAAGDPRVSTSMARLKSINVGVNSANGANLVLETASDSSGTWNTNMLYLDNGGNIGLGVDEPTHKLQIESDTTTTDGINLVVDNLTTGNGITISSNSSDSSSRNLASITNDNSSATGTVLLKLDQDSTGDMIQGIEDASTVFQLKSTGDVVAKNATFTSIDTTPIGFNIPADATFTGITNTNFSGGGTQFVCVDNDGNLFVQGSSCV